MNQRRRTPHNSLKLALAGTVLLALTPGLAPAHAQEVTTLIQFTNVWRYDQSGLDLGAAWRTNTYVETSSWLSGRGLLGWEPDAPGVYTIHSLINTPVLPSMTVTTFYFRAFFNFPGSTNGLSLIASNLVDDGCMMYLNGRPVGGVRAPAAFNASTFFVGGTEGLLEPVTFTNLHALRQGNNLLAVEVHQSFSPSSDLMWGTKLMAFWDLPLAVTNQPQSRAVIEGDFVTFTVGVSGSPAFYRWEKDGVIQPSTSNSLSIVGARPANAGDYRVIVTNSISAATSSVATLTVVPDTFGPTLLRATGNNIPAGGGIAFGSNTINILFSEPVNETTVRNTNNYMLTRVGTTNTVRILSGLYSTALGVLLNVDESDPNWTPGGDYVLTVSNVTDSRGNVIAPDSRIAVSWPQTANVIQFGHPWSFHDSWIFDPDPIATNWYACDFVEGPWWGTGYGPFCGGVLSPIPPPTATCLGCQTQMGYQPEPVLFRTWFQWPASRPTTNTTLQLRFAVDDGAIFYLNGVEIYRRNMPGGPVNSATKAVTIIATPPPCVTNVSLAVTNLVSGSNCFAVAVFQGNNASDADTFFALEFDARYLRTPVLPPESEPVLAATLLDADRLRLSWTGFGYALESVTNLSLGSASYPLGPWRQVTNLSNPYTNRMDETPRFFRLKK